MNDHKPLIERLEALVDRDNQPDWEDVVQRAEAPVQAADAVRARRSTRSYLARRLVPAFVLAAAFIAVGLIAPWQHGPGPTVMGRALAAIEDKPVVHAVFRESDPAQIRYVDLAAGRKTPITITTEIWYDKKRDFQHFMRRFEADGIFKSEVVTDLLITPAKTWTPTSTEPPGGWPPIPPWLNGFFDNYSSALEDGSAHVAGTGTVGGHDVTWIDWAIPKPETSCPNADNCSERIAVDNASSLPVRVEWRDEGGAVRWTVDIDSIETLPAGSGDFSKPEKIEIPAYKALSVCLLYEANRESNRGISVTDFQITPTNPSGAIETLPSALWTGESISSLPLKRMTRAVVDSQWLVGGGAPIVQTGIELVYGEGPVAALWGHESSSNEASGGTGVVIHEQKANPEVTFWPVSTAPPVGSLLTETENGESIGWLEKNGNYVYLRASSPELLLAAARALEPIPKP